MRPEPTDDVMAWGIGGGVIVILIVIIVILGVLVDRHQTERRKHRTKPIQFASIEMVVARTIGPAKTQPVLYQDAGTGKSIAAIITDVNRTDGTVSLVVFPPNAASATHTSVRYDYTGATGTWRYHETDVV
jgi:hypothetical protein